MQYKFCFQIEKDQVLALCRVTAMKFVKNVKLQDPVVML